MAYTIDIYNSKGKKLETKDLNADLFSEENINDVLMREFITFQLANARHPIAHTKTRGEVVGSWRKLYKQKGTWRARVWDAWSPIRRHGWVAFWPRNDVNFSLSMPKKKRIAALASSLSVKARDQEIVWLDSFGLKGIKTADCYKVLKNLALQDTKTLVVLPQLDDVTVKSIRNIPRVKYLLADYLNAYDLLTHKKVLFIDDAIQKIEKIFVK